MPGSGVHGIFSGRMGAEAGAIIAGRYRVLRPLQAGRGGEAYLVEDSRAGGARLALRLLPTGPASAEQRRRLDGAAARLRGLTHPGIVALRDLAPADEFTLHVTDL